MTTEEMKDLANSLDSIQKKLNSGRGVSCVRAVIHYLRLGDLDSAKNVANLEFDKMRQYDDLKEFMLNKSNLLPSYRKH